MSTATDSARALLESLPNRSGMTGAAAALELESIRANGMSSFYLRSPSTSASN